MSTLTDLLVAAQERGASIRPRVGGFPYLAEVLRLAGVRRSRHAVPSGTAVYVFDEGQVVQQGEALVAGTVDVPPFDADRLVAAIRADQVGRTTYPQFLVSAWAAGVLWYEVDLDARTCTYHGAAGDQYVERYVSVELDHLVA